MWWTLAVVAVLGVVLWGPIVSRVEQASYRVAEKQGNIEIRDYDPMIVAEAQLTGDRENAIRAGFRIIADYIFGNNSSAQKVSMTAPVIQQESEKIAMTAPVMQQGDERSWRVRFVMPASYKLDTLPKPNNPAIHLQEIGTRRFAVIRFSGMADAESLRRHTQQLREFVQAKRLVSLSAATYAFFNPPWTLPFLRRNEIMLELEKNK